MFVFAGLDVLFVEDAGGAGLLAVQGVGLLRAYPAVLVVLFAGSVVGVAIDGDGSPVSVYDLSRPLQQIFDASTDWMPGTPQLKVFYPVVEPVAIAMVNGFVRVERTTDVFRHNVAVLEDPSIRGCIRVAFAPDEPISIPGNARTASINRSLRVAMRREPAVMLLAISTGVVPLVTFVQRTHPIQVHNHDGDARHA